MKKGILILTALLFTGTLLSFPAAAQKSRTSDYRKYAKIIREKIYSTYRDYCREPGGHLPFPFIVPGGAQYGNVLWDWDSWLSDIAIHQAAADQGGKALKEIADYEKGCVLNFLRYSGIDGWVPRQYLDERRNPKTRRHLQGKHAQALSGPACGLHRTAERR